jgi:hypothetical protein
VGDLDGQNFYSSGVNTINPKLAVKVSHQYLIPDDSDDDDDDDDDGGIRFSFREYNKLFLKPNYDITAQPRDGKCFIKLFGITLN